MKHYTFEQMIMIRAQYAMEQACGDEVIAQEIADNTSPEDLIAWYEMSLAEAQAEEEFWNPEFSRNAGDYTDNGM